MKKIIKEANEDWFYMQLHMFKQGLLDSKNIKQDLISEFRDNGIIVIRFEDYEDYFKLFGLPEYTLHTITRVFSYYWGNEYMDGSQGFEDWKYGYVVNYFDVENKNLMTDIKDFLAPELDITTSNDDMENFCKIIEDTFPREISDIIEEYISEINNSIEQSLKLAIKEDFCDVFLSDGIYNAKDTCFYKYFTTVDNLIKIYDNLEDKSSDLNEILTKLGLTKNLEDNNYDDWYEFNYMDYFDEESFNRTVKSKLEKIKDDILDEDNFLNIKEFLNIKDKLNSKYRFGNWFDVPKDKNKMFRIINIEPKTNEIVFTYKQKKSNDIIKKSLSLENFNLFLFHPELFD